MDGILAIAERYEPLSRLMVGLGAMAAGMSAVVAIAKYFFDRRAARVNNGLQSYRSYLKMCLDHPELAHPNLEEIMKSTVDYTRYRWFVSNMLMAFEEVGESLSRPVAAEWNAAIGLQLGYHAAYLSSPIFRSGEIGVYSPYVRRMIDNEVAKWNSKQASS